jgi:hypothetical protein
MPVDLLPIVEVGFDEVALALVNRLVKVGADSVVDPISPDNQEFAAQELSQVLW